MDYSYIDKLLERYFNGATSIEEEDMLKAFFRQEELPEHFEKYRSLFNYEEAALGEHLGADFDEKMLRAVEQPVVHAAKISLMTRLRPFMKAAASVAVIITLGTAAQKAFVNNNTSAPDYNYATYKDTYEDPQVAYDKVSTALKDMSDGLRQQMKDDSAYNASKAKIAQ